MRLKAIVCVAAISACKSAGVITYRDFKTDEAKKCKLASPETRRPWTDIIKGFLSRSL